MTLTQIAHNSAWWVVWVGYVSGFFNSNTHLFVTHWVLQNQLQIEGTERSPSLPALSLSLSSLCPFHNKTLCSQLKECRSWRNVEDQWIGSRSENITTTKGKKYLLAMRASFGKEKKILNGTQMREEQSNMSKTYKMRTSFGKGKK